MLDNKSPIPLHVQLKEVLREEILKGKYTDKIPSERELMDQFSVSRSTVRQAIIALVQEGVLEKKHGIGTFVSLRPVEEWLGNLSTFNEIVDGMGMKPNIKLLRHGTENPSKEVARVLGSVGCYFIERLRYADDIPLVIEKKYYPLGIGLKLANYDLNNAAIYDLLETALGIKLWEADQIITSMMPTSEEAKLLQIPENLSVLFEERLVYDVDNNPVIYERSLFRSDMYAFRMKLKRQRN